MDLHAIANSGSYGSGKRLRDRLHAEARARADLPDPARIQPVMASTDPGANWLIASFGNSSEDGQDWHLVTDNVRGMEMIEASLPDDAKADAHAVAAIVNAYRLGVLVVKERDE